MQAGYTFSFSEETEGLPQLKITYVNTDVFYMEQNAKLKPTRGPHKHYTKHATCI
jgi:hypothetical protein